MVEEHPQHQKPLVSVIIPVYNREKMIIQAINTVKDQTYENWELLLVDDGSTDNTAAVIEEHSKMDPRIRSLRNQRAKGPSGARNHGLDNAKGKYIAYQDSDDEWKPFHLEVMVGYLEKYPDELDLMSANPLRKYVETGEVFRYDELNLDEIPHTRIDDVYVIKPDKLFDIQLRGRAITTQCMVGKADIMKRVRWNETLNAAVDIMHNLELAALDIKVGHIQAFHAIYWAHDDNLTNCGGKHTAERMERVQKSFARYWKLVLRKFDLAPQQKSYVKTHLAETLAWHLAYNAYEPQKKYKEALATYTQALILKPTDIKILKSTLKCVVKLIMGGTH